jgi:pyruvate dehydrogenase (quinone)
MSKKVAEVIVETLVAAGVKNCYGIVGDTMNLTAHQIEHSKIDWVHVRHEEAGAFAAAAEASLTGRLTACAGSCGPGGLHFINGLYEANRNRAPVILIASQITRDDLGFESIQEVDFKEVFKGCTVYCDMILTPEQARRKAVLACQAAISQRGVAVLIVPVDIAKTELHSNAPYSVQVGHPIIRANDDELNQIAHILNAGKRIAIYAGAGCQEAHDEVIAVAERLKAPIAHTSRAKDFIEHDNPHNIGMTGLLGTEAGYHAVLNCDTLLLLGADFAWAQFYPDNAKIVQIDINPMHLGRRHPVTLGVVGTVRDTLQALLPRLDPHEDTTFRDGYVERYHDAMATLRANAVPGRDGGIPGPYLTEVINRHAADDALFSADDGTPVVWLHKFMNSNGKRRCFGSLLHGTMASAMPSALGLQKCQPGRQVIAMCGDGGLAMLLGDVLTTIQENLPIKIVVFDNGKLGFVEIEQKVEGLLPVFTDLKNPNFGDVARAMGLWGDSVTRGDDLEEAVKDWLSQPGPALLHVKVNPMELVMPPFVEVAPAVGMALYSTRAVLHGRGGDVWEMVKENFL